MRKALPAFLVLAAALATSAIGQQTVGDPGLPPPTVATMPRAIDEKLFNALQQDNLEAVRRLLKQGASANAIQANGWKPIVLIPPNSKQGIKFVSLLLAHGADINYRQPDQGWTVLTQAVMYSSGDLKYIKFLLDAGAKIGTPIDDGKTALALAVDRGQPDLVSLLLHPGASVSTRMVSDKATLVDPVHTAEPAFKLSGATPIFGLAETWNETVFSLLTRAGADPHAKDDNGWDLLDMAAWQNNEDAVKFLVAKGWDVNEKSNQGFTPLHVAVMAYVGPKPEILKLLVDHGADRMQRNQFGQTPDELFRANTQWRLNAIKGTGTRDGITDYVAYANKVLRAIDPQAAPIPVPAWTQGPWKPIQFGTLMVRKKVDIQNGEAIVELQSSPEQVAKTIHLWRILLDNYECIDHSEITVNIPSGQGLNLKLRFPAIAAKPGLLSTGYEVKTADASSSGGAGDGDWFSPMLDQPSNYPDPSGYTPVHSYAFGIQNLDPKRQLELMVDKIEIGRKPITPGQKGLLLIGPNKTASIDRFVPKGTDYFVIDYRWRLLPNHRWLDAQDTGRAAQR